MQRSRTKESSEKQHYSYGKTSSSERACFWLAVFTALQNKDTAAWLALYPTNEEYGNILQAGLAAKAEGLTQQIIDDILIRRKNEAAAAYSSQFKQYCDLADSIGVV